MTDLRPLANAHRRALLAVDADLSRRLVDLYAASWLRLRDAVDALTQRIEAARAAGEDVSVAWLMRSERLRELEQRLVTEMAQVAQSANGAITDATWQAIRLAQDHAMAQTAAAMGTPPPGVSVAWNLLPTEAVRALAGDLRPGGPLEVLLSDLPGAARAGVRDALGAGIALGEGPAVIARRIRTAMGGTALRATTIARTTVIRAYKDASLASYRANRDIVKGWIWLAALSPRTCAACLAMHGTEHPLDETFHDHPRGRCAAAPKVVTWAELGHDVPEQRQDYGTGEAWLARQPEAVQRRVLGQAKLAAWRAGDIGLADLAGAQHSAVWGKTLTERSLTSVVGADRAREIIAGARA